MKLVLQCAMCGTHHPVGTVVCSACRATGVAQLRLMFECQTCGRLDLSPLCECCPRPASESELVLDLDDLIVAEVVTDEPTALDRGAKDGSGELSPEFDGEGEDEDWDVEKLSDSFEVVLDDVEPAPDELEELDLDFEDDDERGFDDDEGDEGDDEERR